MGGGGFRGGMGGGGFRGGFGGGGFRGGFGGFRGGFRGGFGRFNNRFIGWGGWGGWGGWPWLGSGWWGGGWPWWGGSGWVDPGWGGVPASYPIADAGWGGGGYSAGYPQQPSSGNVTVIYPPQAPASNTVILDPSSSTRQYDQYGQEIARAPSSLPMDSGGGGSPIYLIALRDQTIHAAAAYWVEGSVLHYITLDHQQKLVALSQVDRDLCVKLNRERHIVFSLPVTQ
jgi:hypothetical protein